MQEALLAITKSLSNRGCLFFIGSGVSVEAGLLEASGLAEILCREIPNSSASDLQSAAQEYATIYSDVALKQLIQAQLQARLDADPPLDRTTLSAISRLPECDFITTNWDCLLEDSFRPSSVQPIFLDEEVIYWSREKQNILKMHGCMRSPSSIVVTRREYEEYSEKHPNIVLKLRSLFLERLLVICGYSMVDTPFREIYRAVTTDLGAARLPVYWVDPFAKKTSVHDWNAFGIRFVPATAKDFFQALGRLVGSGGDSESLKEGGESRQGAVLEARRVLELEKAFAVLQHGEIDDYDFFNSKFTQIRLTLEGFARTVERIADDLNLKQLTKLRQISEALYEVPTRIGGMIDQYGDNITVQNPSSVGILLRDLIDGAAKPLDQIRSTLARRERIVAGEGFADVEVDQERVDDEVVGSLNALVSKRGFAEFSELIGLLGSSRNQLAQYLSASKAAPELKKEVFERLWRHFDIVFLFENPKESWKRSSILQAIMRYGDESIKKKVAAVISLFSRDIKELSEVELRLVSLREEGDKVVIWRCLAFHLYSQSARKYAMERIGEEALWTLVALENFPLWALRDAGEHLLDSGDEDSAKLLIDVKYRDFEALLSAARQLQMGEAKEVVEFLVLLKGSRVLFMDSYFERYARLIRMLEEKFGGDLGEEFLELSNTVSTQAEKLEPAWPPGERSFRRLPKSVKKKLADNMLYVHYLATSDDDELAMLCSNLITDTGFAASIMLSKQINASLLAWIAKSRKLMSSYGACRNLLFNPKAQASYGAVHMGRLRPHDLELLRASHDVNGAIRQIAANIVRKRGGN